MSNKLRNRFLAILCLLAFAGLGLLYYTNWVVQKPFAVILFLSDNFSASALAAARIYGGGADERLAVERFPNLALLSSHAADFAVADAESASTALATGHKTNNRNLGQTPDGIKLQTLAEIARLRGRAVGLVTNGRVAGPGLGAFYAQSSQAADAAGVALQLAGAQGFELVLGGGASDFIPEHKGGRRTDGRDLSLEMRGAGFDIIRTSLELESTPTWRAPRLLGLFAGEELAFSDEVARAGGQPSLAGMVRQAIQLLQFNRRGYLLVVEAGLVGKAAMANDGERTLRELLQLDAAVATALAYAGENSLIVVAGRSSVGGLRLNGFPFRNDKGLAVVGLNAQGVPSLTWSTGPAGRENLDREPVAAPVPETLPVAEDALAVAVGPGAVNLTGFKDNTDVFRTLVHEL